MLLGVPISTSIMQLSEENVGSNSMNVQKIDSGWMDGCDAIYSSGKSKTNSLNTRESVSFLFFSTEDKKNSMIGANQCQYVQFCFILFIPCPKTWKIYRYVFQGVQDIRIGLRFTRSWLHRGMFVLSSRAQI